MWLLLAYLTGAGVAAGTQPTGLVVGVPGAVVRNNGALHCEGVAPHPVKTKPKYQIRSISIFKILIIKKIHKIG